jgi:hypothetical protein
MATAVGAVGAIVVGAAIGGLTLPIMQDTGVFVAIALPTTAVLDAWVGLHVLEALDALGLAVGGALDGAKPVVAAGSGLLTFAPFPKAGRCEIG